MLNKMVEKQKNSLCQVMENIPLNTFENKIEKGQFAFSKKILDAKWSLIAECKLASPVKGVFCNDKTVKELALIYEQNGATALSVHTNEHFKGVLSDLCLIKEAVKIPVMRKEFIIHPYQVYETAYQKVDALLLIARILSEKQLTELLKEAQALGLDCLVETHDEADIYKSLSAGAKIIGINNRDLTSFVTDINVTLKLKELCGDRVVISESGINTLDDLEKLKAIGVRGILVGEGLVTAENIAKKTRQMAMLEGESND